MMAASMAKPISDFASHSGLPADLIVTGLQLDSRQVKPGDLFFAVPGDSTDGRKYISQAIEQGAIGVLSEGADSEHDVSCSVPVAYLDNLSEQLGKIASYFYDEPSRDVQVIAVTGTNGKTSCCHFVAEALTRLGTSCGVMGTLGYGVGKQVIPYGLTTPDPISFQCYLLEMKNAGARAIALEASSHGLAQRRLSGTLIDVAVFTNLTRDHLDYHETLQDYQASKKSLFMQDGVQTAIINLDDAFGRQLNSELVGQFNVLTYSTESTSANVSCSDIVQSKTGVSAVVRTPWGTGLLSSGLYGIFNLSNLLAVVCVLGSQGFELGRILEVLSELNNVKGRMDRITLDNGLQVVIDYAHTPDALENVLKTLRHHCDGNIWCVFGCGGDRDRGKRSEMGRISVRESDYVVLTDDNPRTESREQIIQDILSGIEDRSRVFVEADRGTAIRFAIQKTESNDTLLIAGKGHEDYQDINGTRVNYSDYEEVHHAAD